MNNQFRSTLLTLLAVCFTAHFSQAQYPVQVMPQIISPASLTLSDYYTGAVPKLFVTLTNRDLQKPNLRVKLRVKISSGQVELKTNEAISYMPITLDPGVPTRLYSKDLEQYLNPANLVFQGITQQQYLSTGQLPEGMYSFCFEVVESSTNRVLSQPNQCAMVWISLTEPPLLNMPMDNSDVVQKEPSFIVFSWTPRHQSSPNSATNSQYEFELVEILDINVDPNAAFSSSRVLYKTTLKANSLVYGPSEPLLLPGKRYGWRVRLVPTDLTQDFDKFRNNGYSNINSFNYKAYQPRFEIEKFTIANNELNLNWNKVKGYEGLYSVQFKSGSYSTTPVMASSNQYSLSDIKESFLSNLNISEPGDYKIDAYVSYFNAAGDVKIEKSEFFTFDSINSNEEITNKEKETTREPDDTINRAPIDKTPATDVLNTKTALFQGRVQWSYFAKNSENKVSLFASESKAEKSTVLTKQETPTNKFSLEGATVKLFVTINGNKELLKTTTTDKLGHYRILAVSDEAGVYSVEVEHKSGQFSNSQVTSKLEPNNNVSDSKYIANNDHNLLLNNSELDLAIYASQLTQNQTEGFKIEVYLESTKFNNTYGKVNGNLNIDEQVVLNHNRSNYYKIGEVKNGSSYIQLLPNQNNLTSYLLVLSSPTYPNKIISIPAPNMYMRAKHTIDYEVFPSIFGMVSGNGKTLAQSNVEIIINKEDVLGQYTEGKLVGSTYVINQQTDYYGDYDIRLPLLKKEAKVEILISNKLASYSDYSTSIALESKTKFEFNHDFKNKTYTFTGQVTMSDGLTPIPGMLVTDPATGDNIKTTKNGYFLLQKAYNAADKIKISGDGYEPIEVSMAGLKLINIYTPSDETEKEVNKAADDWANNILKLDWVNNYLKSKNISSNDAGVFKSACDGQELKSIYAQLQKSNYEDIGGLVSVEVIKLAPKNIKIKMGIKVDGKPMPGKIRIYKGEVLFKELRIEKAGDSVEFIGPAGFYKIFVVPLEDNEKDFVPYQEELNLAGLIYGTGYGMKSVELENQVKTESVSFIPMEFSTYLSPLNERRPIIFLLNSPNYQIVVEVISKKDNKPIEGATIMYDNVAQTLKTGNDGRFRIEILKGTTSLRVGVRMEGFNEYYQTIDFTKVDKTKVVYTMEEAPVSITSISGYDVKLTRAVAIPGVQYEYTVSGIMTFPKSLVFGVADSTQTAEFENVKVKLNEREGDSRSAYAIGDFTFKPSVIKGKAYDAYDVEIENLKMVNATGDAIIKAAKVKVKLSGSTGGTASVKNVMGNIGEGAFLMQAKAAFNSETMSGELTASLGTTALTSIVTVFDTKGKTDDSLTTNKIFQLLFTKKGAVEINLMGDIKFAIKTDAATIDKDGINLFGALPIPAVMNPANQKQTFPVKALRINKSLQGIDVILNDSLFPFIMKVQKINAELTGLTLLNLGSANPGITLQGKVWLNKAETVKGQTNKDQNVDRGNVLIIQTFELNKVNDGLSVKAVFNTEGGKGIKIKGLSFSPEGGTGIGFSLNTTENTFELNVGGIVKYEGTAGAAASKVFGKDGILVDFRLRTKDWAFLMTAKSNQTVKLGVATISISSFLLNVGYGVDMDAMSAMLAKIEVPKNETGKQTFLEPKTKESLPELVEESKTSWAIGVAGGVAFPIKGMGIDISGRFVLANIDNSIKFKLDSIALEVVTPAAVVKVNVTLNISNEETEIKGGGEFKVMGNGFATDFSYKETGTEFKLAANLKVTVATPIITGPVGWLAIGGGFNVTINKNQKGGVSGLGEIGVYLTGEITAAGGARQTMYMSIDTLKILYEGSKLASCNKGMLPITVSGQVSLMIKEEKWAMVKAAVDFCYQKFSLTIKAEVPELVPGMPKIFADGIVEGAGSRDGGYKPYIYLGINVTLNTGIINGAGNIAFGINVIQTHPSLSNDVKKSMYRLDQEVMQQINGARYFHGIVVNGSIDLPSSSQSFGVDLPILGKFGVSYSYKGSASAKVFVNFIPETVTPKVVKVAANMNFDAAAEAMISGFKITGKIAVNSSIMGGYEKPRGWYASGSFNSTLNAHAGRVVPSVCENKFGLSVEDIYNSVSQELFYTVYNTNYACFSSCDYWRPCASWSFYCCRGSVTTSSWGNVLKFVSSITNKVGVQVCFGVKGSFKYEANVKSFSINL